METRGRGREARASTDDNRPVTNTRQSNHDSGSQPQLPSTRSRSRRAPPAPSSTRSTRSRRPSRSIANQHSPSGRPIPTANPQASSPSNDNTAPPVPLPLHTSTSDRPRRSPPSRRPSNPSTSAPPVPEHSTRPSRKRTRSTTRRVSPANPSAGSSAAPGSSSAAPVATSASQSGSRPSKRPRRSLNPQRSSRTSGQSSSATPGPSTSAQPPRRTRGMSSNPGGDGGPDRSNSVNERLDEDGPSSLGSDRAGPTTLQGLLRRLGADLSDIFPGSSGTSHTHLQQLRNSINNPESNEQQIDALTELCEFLSVGTEESMVSFSVNLFVGPLVNLLRTGANVEVKILAARALTHMMEALPSSSSAIAINGGAGPLCENLLSIEYIDLAEQSLSALNKLSVDHPQQIVSANGFQAVLAYIDFFSIGVQQVAAATACNLCRGARPEIMDMISGVLPSMMNLVSSDDQRIRESAILGFVRLAESLRSSSDKLETLSGDQAVLIEKILNLAVPPSPPALSPQSYSYALRLLSLLARGSAKLGIQILSTESLISKLQQRLTAEATSHAIDCLNLADSMLPEMLEVENSQGTQTRHRRRRGSSSATATVAVDAKRREELEQKPEVLHFFGRLLFEPLMKFYVSSADTNARRISLSVMAKFISIASEDVLQKVLTLEPEESSSEERSSIRMKFCPFVAALLGENSSINEIVVGLAMAASALQKLPTLRDSFYREGVVHEIVRLSANEDVQMTEGEQPASAPANSSEQAGDQPTEATANTASDENTGSSDARNLESVWNAVASLQRAAVFRNSHRDASSQHRFTSRAPLELRSAAADANRQMIPKAAKSVLRTHLGADADGTLNDGIFRNRTLGQLTKICSTLSDTSDDRDEAKGLEALSKLVKLLTAPEGLTVFEVSKSGALASLCQYLLPPNAELAPKRIENLLKCLNDEKCERAFTTLVSLSLGVLSSSEKLTLQTSESSHGGATPSVNSGLRHLSQPFKLRLRRAPVGNGGAGLRDYAHHVVLIEPLATMSSVQEFLWPRVREPESQPSVSTGAASSSRRRSSRGERPENEQAGGNDSVSPSAGPAGNEEEDEWGGQRLEVEEEIFNLRGEYGEDDAGEDQENEEQNSDPSDEEVSSGEEDMIEQDTVESEDNENEGADSLDVDQLTQSMPPFELDHDALGQAPNRSTTQGAGAASGSAGPASRAGDSNVSEPGSSPTFRSYAAALAANFPRAAGQPTATGAADDPVPRMPGQEDRRRLRKTGTSPATLSFSLNGVSLAQDCSILSAIVQSTQGSRGIGSRLWSDVHTLVYGQPESQPSSSNNDESADKGRPTPSKDGSSAGGPLRRSQRLQENKGRSRSTNTDQAMTQISELPCPNLKNISVVEDGLPLLRNADLSDLPEDIAVLINVLRQLHWIYDITHDGPVSSEGLAVKFPSLLIPSEIQFFSNKLSAKLLRQLSDPLALCGGVIPDWCFSLARDAPFLIPFDTRRVLFQSTSLGVTRALHLLQTRTDLSGGGNNAQRPSRAQRDGEMRIGRIQRQKVRVHRHRILESAIKVMNYYSNHSTVLEVQYFDEAGIGLGPTLEFYTMASRELQRIDLGLWRCSSGSNGKTKDTTGSSTASDKQKSLSRSTGRRRSRRHSQSTEPVADNDVTAELDSPAFIISTGSGLFPSCLPIVSSDSQSEFSEKTTALFGFVGRLLGKAMIDGRLLDLRFSQTFSRLLLSYCRVLFEQRRKHENEGEKSKYMDISSRGKVRTLHELDQINREEVWNEFTSGTSAMGLLKDVDKQLASSLQQILDLVTSGEAVSNLALTFVLPGDDKIELVEGGAEKEVDSSNAAEFVRHVVYHVLFGGVYQQAEALLRGLGDLLDLTRLLMFQGPEVELIMCGPSFENWSVEFLTQATRCDHGYSHDSTSVQFFLRILSEMTQQEQQMFVIFTTGAPALPLGGLKNLHPRLTIVRRTPEAGRSPDECLPTVMTCTNYFKLPDYSSFEIAKKQVLCAVREGQRSFHLS